MFYRALSAVTFLLVTMAPVIGQPLQTVAVVPDCQIPFQFTAANQVAPANANSAFNNKQVGCNVWQVQYANTGFTVVSLVLQSAPDVAGVPGAFSTISGTVTQGVNPQTNTTGSSNLITTFGTAFAPWVRMTPTTATGSGQITGIALGWRQLATAGASVSGSVNATIVSPLGQTSSSASVPVVLSNDLINGCTKNFFNLAASGNTQIVAAVAAQNIYICDLEFSTGTPENFKLTEGTGVNCATGTADSTALMQNISAWSLTPGGGVTASRTTATTADALCANQANAQAAAVTIWFIQR